jgi:hypothetical protein
MPKQELENWLDIDNNAEVVAAMKVSIIRSCVQKVWLMVPENKKTIETL